MLLLLLLTTHELRRARRVNDQFTLIVEIILNSQICFDTVFFVAEKPKPRERVRVRCFFFFSHRLFILSQIEFELILFSAH